jgi:actin-related protein
MLDASPAFDSDLQLPDGRVIKVGRERYMAPECLFSPDLVSMDCMGMSGALYDSIENCEVDLRAKLRQYIVLSGGSTMYPGLPSRYATFSLLLLASFSSLDWRRT